MSLDTNTTPLDGIAIIGMSGRFPRAKDTAQFWQNLVNGVDGVTRFSEDELEFTSATPDAIASGQKFVRARATLENVDLFDAAFFGIYPREAEQMDPQHRLFLECAWEAIESAGHDPAAYPGMIAVYAGLSLNTYLLYNLCINRQYTANFAGKFQVGEYQAMLGNDKDFLPTRVSYRLNLRGPAMAVQCGCSTSLVAINQACSSLLAYQSDMALAGGVSISFPQKRDYPYTEDAMVSGDGTCHTFDAGANGTIFGHGVGVVLLKRLEDAVADHDNILAVIKGTALNNDGGDKISYTAPSIKGQAEVIAMAQAAAAVDPETISYVEAHGTGTPLGDPIEIAALTQAFRNGGATRNGYCAVGSGKTHIGHLDAAAGVTGLIKTVLQLQHEQIPPLLHFKSPNPKIDFANSPFYPVTKLTDWKRGATPRRAGVSAFGVGGTNAHLIVEEAPLLPAPASSRPQQLLVLSAKSEAALQRMSENLAAHLEQQSQTSLADTAFTLALGRRGFPFRRALIAADSAEAVRKLRTSDAKSVITGKIAQRTHSNVFLFPGQGAQYVDMGRELYDQEPAYLAEVDRCAELLLAPLGLDIRHVLYPDATQRAQALRQINETWVTQPSIFVVEYALAQLWISWGIKPDIVIGHSIGEYVAAVIAGSCTLEDALKLLVQRAKLMQALPAGSMMAVRLGPDELKPLLPANIALAALNSASLTTLSGPTEPLQAFQKELDSKNIAARLLPTSHAFHSEMMEPMVAPFTDCVRQVKFTAPKLRWISTCTGTEITAEVLADPAYWARQLRQSVRFSDAIATVVSDPQYVLLEVGPGQALTSFARQHPRKHAETLLLPSLAANAETARDLQSLLSALGRLWTSGISPDWRNYFQREQRRRVPLPTYPFERKRFWIEPPAYNQTDNTKPNPVSTGNQNPANPEPAANSTSTETVPSTGNAANASDLISEIRALFSKLSGIEAPDLTTSFIELGADSLFLAQFSQAVETRFSIKITFRQLMHDLSSLTALSNYIAQKLPAPPTAPIVTPATSTPQFEVVYPEPRRLSGRKSAPDELPKSPLIPITEGQSEIWLAMQLAPEMACAYNDVLIVSIRGSLDETTLRTSLHDLIARHDALRLTFSKDGKTQQVASRLAIDAPVSDLSSLDRNAQDERINATARQEDATTFNLENGPLLRLHLFKRSRSEHVLLLAYHHLIVDGWSAGVLVRDLAALYAAHSHSLKPALPPAMQFSDYVAWQNEPAQIASTSAAEQYWLEQFADLPTSVELPRDRARSTTRDYTAAYKSIDLEAELCRRFRQTAGRAGSTVFTSLCATFIAWLHRVTGQNDIVIGVPNAGQSSDALHSQPGSAELVGHCVDFLPIRVTCEGNLVFTDHVNNVQNRLLDAKEHQSFALGSLVKKLNVPRDANRAPLIPVIFNFIPFTNEVKQASGIEWQAEYNAKGFNLFDLVVFVTARGQELRINCEYRTAFYDSTTIDRWLAGLRTMIESVAAAPEKRIDELDILAPTERHLLLSQWNATHHDYPRDVCVHQLFEAQASTTPEAVAVVFEGQTLTYRELNTRADALALYLKSIGVGPDVLVGLCVHRSLEMVVGILGILKAGGAYVPIDPTYPADRIAFVLEDAQARALLTQRALLSTLPETAAQRIFIDEPLPPIAKPVDRPTAPTASNLAYVIYTSGSTGKPKGVQIEHRAVVNFLNSMRREPGLTAKDTLLAVTTLSFDIAGLELHLPLTTGARVVIVPWQTAVDGAALIKTIEQHEVTLLQATPATWRILLAAGWQGTPGMKILCGGEPLPPELTRELLPRCAELWNMYGPTETTIWSTCCRVTDASDITIGNPIDNTTVYIVDSNMTPVPVGTPGELLIGGDGLARGYFNRPELTAEKFITHPTLPDQRLYRTGDLARYRANGAIECLGRLDFQVKLRGFRIELGEIETVLTHHAQIQQAVVIAREDTPGDKRLVAYISARPGTELSISDVREHTRGKLPDYMLPAAFVVLETFPLTPNGKVDRKRLPSPTASDLTAANRDEPPANAVEESLAAIWCRILNLPSVGRHQSFFELGGNSLLAVTVFAEIEKEFKHQLPLAVLFDHPTIAGLAEPLNTISDSDQSWPSLIPINSKGAKPRFYCVHGAGGNVLLYRSLAAHLGEEYPFYGIQSRGLDGKLAALRTIEDMAAYYVTELQRMQPHGPYLLGGYCLGGSIALEMARLLTSKGESVPLVAMLDSYNPALAVKTSRAFDIAQRLKFHLKNFLRLTPVEMKNYLKEKTRVARDGEFKKVFNLRAAEDLLLPGKAETNGDSALKSIQAINDQAINAYRPKPYTGKLTLFKPRVNYKSFPDPKMGWGEIAQGGVEIMELSMNPHAMLVEPFVQDLAKTLAAKIDLSANSPLKPAP
ncbi:MAG: amino acid adenylation domain-containing protein [Verrucomicrobia bacterium]|nr:amino acid adenylation domain-containing protein [Verrucomicrobiota bacterium]